VALLSLTVIAVCVGNIIWTANQAQQPRSQVPTSVDWARTSALFIAAFAAAMYLVQFLLDHSLGGLIGPEAAAERVRRVRASGPRLAKQTPNLRLGDQRYQGSGLSVSVYPGGIVIKPLFMRARAILGEEIRRISTQPVLMQRDDLVIEHDGSDAPSPLQFYSTGLSNKTGKLSSALGSLADGWAASRTADTPASAGLVPLTGEEGFLRGHPIVSQAVGFVACVAFAAIVVVGVIPQNALFGIVMTGVFVLVAIYCARNVVLGLRGRLH
jgi:hypothetical protein